MAKNGSGTRFIGSHADTDFHKQVKIKCAEKGLTIQEAVIKGLCLLLEIDEKEEAAALEKAE